MMMRNVKSEFDRDPLVILLSKKLAKNKSCDKSKS